VSIGKIAAAAAVCLILSANCAQALKVQHDGGLATFYSSTGTSVAWSTCGYLDSVDACYGAGTLPQTFASVCAVMEGERKQKGKKITRDVYVLDRGTAGNSMILYVFARTDDFPGDGTDVITVKPQPSVLVQLEGGPGAHCMMAASASTIYIGSDVGAYASEVSAISKSTGLVNLLVYEFSGTVVSITAEERNFVALHFQNVTKIMGPGGDLYQSIAGPGDMADQHNAWKPD
jgi:hypothetical protein